MRGTPSSTRAVRPSRTPPARPRRRRPGRREDRDPAACTGGGEERPAGQDQGEAPRWPQQEA
ncbi:Dehydrin COR410 [Zea mays]|uniref:Dehydrin COR410 n=1 Tax=Zea mays TaxID=4577 RepID=A0A1D6HFK1_MAIZE|nr:Dehydrin COR410 [Zea mays]AQK73414.1 Dehydrin COR410 [Zea mays]